MAKLGLICRMDLSGLGNQTRNLARLLKPDKIILINSSSFNGREQYPEWYSDYKNIEYINGFILDQDIPRVLKGIDKIVTCELFYNNKLINEAKALGVETYNMANWEFLDNLQNKKLPIPTKFLWPSYWKLENAQRLFPGSVEYLPPPTWDDSFKDIRNINLSRTGKPRFLHIVGRQAIHDRPGTLDLLEALKYTKADFELVIKMQEGSLPDISDPRVIIDTSSPENEAELYKDFDAFIQLRRYGGLNLPMCEALAAGLPVIMPNISPNYSILPQEWLVQASPKDSFMARTKILIHKTNPFFIADKLTWLCQTPLDIEKEKAYTLYKDNYSPENLKPKYKEVLGL